MVKKSSEWSWGNEGEKARGERVKATEKKRFAFKSNSWVTLRLATTDASRANAMQKRKKIEIIWIELEQVEGKRRQFSHVHGHKC